jgi:hypothetical protein
LEERNADEGSLHRRRRRRETEGSEVLMEDLFNKNNDLLKIIVINTKEDLKFFFSTYEMKDL